MAKDFNKFFSILNSKRVKLSRYKNVDNINDELSLVVTYDPPNDIHKEFYIDLGNGYKLVGTRGVYTTHCHWEDSSGNIVTQEEVFNGLYKYEQKDLIKRIKKAVTDAPDFYDCGISVQRPDGSMQWKGIDNEEPK